MDITSAAVLTSKSPLMDLLRPSVSYSLTMRVRLPQRRGMVARVTTAVADAGGMLGALDIVEVDKETRTRDIVVLCADVAHGERIVEAVRALDGIAVESVV